MLYKIQARASRRIPLRSVLVLYGIDWEDCEGSENLTLEECQEIIRDWQRDDRLTAREMGFERSGAYPHDYQVMPMPTTGE